MKLRGLSDPDRLRFVSLLCCMPTRLTRYILIEIFKIFVISLIALTALILLIGVARELVRQGLGPMSVVELLPYIMPIALQFAFPATALFSVCCVYGRMAAEGEVATVKSSGVSPVQLLQPAFVFAALLSPISVITFDLAVSWGRPGINRVVLSSIEDIAYRVLASRRSYTSEYGFSIHVQDVVDRRLIRPTVTIHNGNPRSWIASITATEKSICSHISSAKSSTPVSARISACSRAERPTTSGWYHRGSSVGAHSQIDPAIATGPRAALSRA